VEYISKKVNEHIQLNKTKMKDYKVETLIYYSKLTLDSEHIAKKSKQEIQEKLDEYAKNGYKLASSNATSFGGAVYIYLYFEKEI
jgi:galactokinase/mevalonate kinase-like predicted kinase